MDLNYLYSRHQISLMCAMRAASPEARCAHRGLARAYAERIRALRRSLGAPVIAALAK